MKKREYGHHDPRGEGRKAMQNYKIEVWQTE